MKRIALILLLLTACSVSAQKVNQATLRDQIRGLKEQQREEINRVEKNLKASKDYAISLWTDLDKAQEQLNKVGKERDGWRDYGNDQHEKLMNAEVRVAKKQATILKLSGVIGLMTLAIGVYAFLKFYMRLPI